MTLAAGANPSVFLIGFRASGKTAVGRELARRLGCGLVDTDRLVEEGLRATTAVKTIAECFARLGEPEFRARETEALESTCRRIAGGERLVVATGGGIVLAERNQTLLRGHGWVAWLTAAAAVLRERLQADASSPASRPALTAGGTAADEIPQLLAAREPKYREAANQVISTENRDPDTIAAEIEAALSR